MEASLDLNTFTKILTDKGYSGYFHTQGAYPGKLKDSISEYLESCQKGADSLPKEDLLLTGYLQWSGDDKPRVECSMRVKYHDGRFSLIRMEVAKKDRFGHLINKTEVPDLSVISVPKLTDAVALVDGQHRQEPVKSVNRFRL